MYQRLIYSLVFSLFCLSGVVLASEKPVAESIKLPAGLISLNDKTPKPLVLHDIDGEEWNIESARGRWLFVHFWASWCGPCRIEMPAIQTLSGLLDKSRMEIYLINTAENEDTVFTFLAAVAPDLVPLMDIDGRVTERWQPRGLPATFLVDPEGIARYVALGGRPWDQARYVDFLKSLYLK